MVKRLAYILAFCLCLVSGAVSGKTPEEIFAEVAPSVTVVYATAKNATDTKQGTGVVLAPGIIATNCHLFTVLATITVIHQQKKYSAKLKHQNRPYDLCILDVSDLKAPPVRSLASVKSLRVGQPVYAIGTPFGLELTLTEGLVSALRQIVDEVIIQTSASIAPGSSGGGLFDSNGALIGITSAGISEYQGFNFAVPVDWISQVLAGGSAGTIVSVPEASSENARWSILEGIQPSQTNSAPPFLAFNSLQEARGWLNEMSARLVSEIPERGSREEFLVTAHYEAKRAGLDPQLVLALIQVARSHLKNRFAG